jgi:hypothetical protein
LDTNCNPTSSPLNASRLSFPKYNGAVPVWSR